MARYLMLALNSSTSGEGDEEDCNRWHDEVHMPDFKAIENVKSARRYRIVRGKMPGLEAWRYMTVYEIETDDLAALSQRFATELRPFPASLDRSTSGNLMAVQISGDD